jgi:hypothetical protein
MLAKPDAGTIPVTMGGMTTTRVPGGPFRLVYLVANTIMNVTTQDDQRTQARMTAGAYPIAAAG